jgi:hypothetical protein
VHVFGVLQDGGVAAHGDYWSGLESQALGLLEKGTVEGARALVDKLEAKFGSKSSRVQILKAMILVRVGTWELASWLTAQCRGCPPAPVWVARGWGDRAASMRSPPPCLAGCTTNRP